MQDEFIAGKKALQILGISLSTLYRYDKDGIIETIRTPGGKRLYNIKSYLAKSRVDIKDKNESNKKKICYARVSSNSQKTELLNQINYMKQLFPDYIHLNDIGSGINFNRKNLNLIIDYAIKGELDVLVISYKDRLCRIGNDLIENILKKYSNTKIIILNDDKKSPEEEIVDDLIQIITVFSSRVYGLRNYKKKLNEEKTKLLTIVK